MPRFISDEEMKRREASPARKKAMEEASGAPEISALASTATGALSMGGMGALRPLLTAAGMATGTPMKESWKMSGEFVKEAKKQNPTAYNVGGAAGLLVPMGAGAKLGSTLIKGARPAIGALAGETLAAGGQAAGQALSEATPENAADDFLNAMATNIVGAGAGSAIKLGGKAVFKGGRRIIEGLTNINPKSIDVYMANPKAVKALISSKMEDFVPQLSDDLTKKMQEVSQGLEAGLQEITSKVKNPIKMDPVISEIESQFNQLDRLGFTPQKDKAANVMYGMWSKFQKRLEGGQKFTASDLLELKRDFQDAAQAIYRENGSHGPADEAFGSVAKKAADYLKRIVPGSAEILKKQEKAITARDALGLGTEVDPARLKNLLSSLFNPDKVQKGIPKLAKQFDEVYGTNVTDSANLFRAAVDLGKDDIFAGYGTGRALLGPALGAMSAGGAGGFAGLLLQSPAAIRHEIGALKAAKGAAGYLGGKLPKAARIGQATGIIPKELEK